jgi:hypothetical protein
MSDYYIIWRRVFEDYSGKLVLSSFLYSSGAFRGEEDAYSIISYINPYYSIGRTCICSPLKVNGFNVDNEHCIINGVKCKISSGLPYNLYNFW